MSEKKSKTRSKSMSSQRSGSDSPAKPEPEETSPICSGGSQNVPLPTWETFDTSNCTDEGAQAEVSAKKEKDKKSAYKKFRKGIKKVITGKKSSHHAGKKEQKITEEYDDPNVQMSLIATEVNLHPKEDDITLEKIMQGDDLKAQLQAFGSKNSKAKLDQMEIHSEEETEEPSDLKKVVEILTSELKSIKSQLTRAECELSDINMEKSALTKEMEKLEEENSELQTISGDGNSCSNLRCQALQHQVYLLQEEFEESKRRVTSFEKTVAHLQQEKNSALEQCSLAKVEAEIFKSDFQEERRDRTKAQGLLADFQNKYKEQDTLLRQERDGAIQERNYLKRELSKAKVELAQADGLKEGLKHHINETEEMIRQRDYYRELYEKVKPLESEVEISKKEITQLRAHIESLMRKGKLKEKELKAAEEQEDAFAVKQEKEILSKDLERKASRPSIGNEQPKIHNKGESSYPIRRSKHNKQGFDVMLNPNASGCRFDRSGSEYQSYPALEIGDLSEAERTSLKELIKQSSSIHGGEDKDVRHDQSYLSLEVGDFSEAERTGLKESSSIDGGEDKDMRHVYQEQEDVEDMYKAMEDLGHEQQVKKVTDVHMPFDTNLICPLCRKQFRIGEIQKYKKHVDECA